MGIDDVKPHSEAERIVMSEVSAHAVVEDGATITGKTTVLDLGLNSTDCVDTLISIEHDCDDLLELNTGGVQLPHESLDPAMTVEMLIADVEAALRDAIATIREQKNAK